jgi:N-acetylglutamate synthase-like GNAT family acetyltransferase
MVKECLFLLINSNVVFRKLVLDDLSRSPLTEFNRYQKTIRILVKAENNLYEKDDCFIDDLNDEKKANVTNELRHCIQSGGAFIGAFNEGKLVGVANVENQQFGKFLDYVELPYIHVSNESRSCGIGKRLFYLCCESAKKFGAKKLYIGAHPSIETQSFYKDLGCTLAKEINEDIFNREPLDIQLEYRF